MIPRVLVSGTICEGEVSEPGKHVTASALDSMHQALMRFATAIASNLGDLKLYTGFPWPTDGGPVLREVEGHQNAVRWTKEALLTHVRGAMQLVALGVNLILHPECASAAPMLAPVGFCGFDARQRAVPTFPVLRGGGEEGEPQVDISGTDWQGMLNSMHDPNKGATPPLSAARDGNVGAVKKLLREGAPVDEAIPSGATALHLAAGFNHQTVVRELLDAGASVQKADEDGDTALHGAAAVGGLDVVRALLIEGADVNHASKDGTSPLLIAAQRGHVDLVRELIRAGADVNKPHSDGATALSIATEQGHTEVMRLLIDAGAIVATPPIPPSS